MEQMSEHFKDCVWFKAAVAGTIGVATIIVVKKYKASTRNAKLRDLWNSRGKDVVTVHMFNRSPTGPNPSPYPIKVETYLRMAGIKYFPDFEEPMSTKGKCPWITLNGVDVADSQLAIEYVTKALGKDIESHLSPAEKALSRSLRCLIEDHLTWCIGLERWYYHNAEDPPKYCKGIFPSWFPDWLVWHMFRKFGKQAIKAGKAHGIGRHTQAEVEAIGKADIDAVSAYLGDKKYLLGDKPCIADCTLFGFTCIMLVLPDTSRSVHKKHIEANCKNLLQHHKTIREEFWPDYDKCVYEGK